jgi:hypothetical protein
MAMPIVLGSTDAELRWFLIRHIKESPDQPEITYGEVKRRLVDTYAPFHMGGGLGRICEYEHAHGRPLLSAIVVTDTGSGSTPGSGFYPMAARLLGHPVDEHARQAIVRSLVQLWTDPDPSALSDRSFDALWRRLQALRRPRPESPAA